MVNNNNTTKQSEEKNIKHVQMWDTYDIVVRVHTR